MFGFGEQALSSDSLRKIAEDFFTGQHIRERLTPGRTYTAALAKRISVQDEEGNSSEILVPIKLARRDIRPFEAVAAVVFQSLLDSRVEIDTVKIKCRSDGVMIVIINNIMVIHP